MARFSKGDRIATLNPVAVYEPNKDQKTHVAAGAVGTVTRATSGSLDATLDGISGGPWRFRRALVRKVES